jgi:uncharacterized membrane protein
MYQLPSEDDRPGCRDAWVLTRAVFAILLPPLFAIFFVLVMLVAAIVLFAEHPALALIPIAALGLALAAFVYWERKRFRPPDL